METKEDNKKWHLIRNDNGEWISDENVVIVSKMEIGVLKAWAAKQGKTLSVQHGTDGILWCYKHEIEAIDVKNEKTTINRKLRIKKYMGKKNVDIVYQGRGLHSSDWSDSLSEDGKLYGLIEIVSQDKDLVLEIRDDYFNIYYKGGNMLKVMSENSFQFDYNYFKGSPELSSDDKKEERKGKRKELLKSLKKNRDYKGFVCQMKKIMDKYWKWLEKERNRSLEEKNVQHELCIRNTEQSDYTIIDLEYQVSTDKTCPFRYQKTGTKYDGRFVSEDKTSPRFDIIAVRNSDHQLCVIELKKGIDAIYGLSGIGDHADSFEGSIEREPQAFLEEMKGIVANKKGMNLLDEDFFISNSVPEFIFAYSFNDDSLTKEQQKGKFMEELKRSRCDKYKVIFLDEGCYTLSDCNMV